MILLPRSVHLNSARRSERSSPFLVDALHVDLRERVTIVLLSLSKSVHFDGSSDHRVRFTCRATSQFALDP